MSVDTPTMMLSVLEHLAAAEGDMPEESRPHVASAISSLSSAFNLSLDDPKQVRQLSLKPHTLVSVFGAGCAALGAKSAAQQLAELESSEAFGQFVKVVSAKGYFKGAEEGSEAYDERMSKLVAKFRARTEAASGRPAVEEGSSVRSVPPGVAATGEPKASSSAAGAEPSTGAKAADEKKAEEVKGEGNKLLLAKDYEGAEKCYTRALELSPAGPNSHVYLCNRAAALCYLGRNDDAVVDCQEAIDLNPSYAKAYTRLGYAYFQLEDYEASVKAYKKSLEIEPGNAANTKSLRRAISKLGAEGGDVDEISTRGGAGGAGGMPDLSGLASMMGGAGGGGGGGLASMLQGLASAGGGGSDGAPGGGSGGGGLAGMLNNPNMLAQAQQMMQNPAMMAQVQKMMSNPAMMQGLMGMMGGGGGGSGGSGGGGGGGGPDLSALASMMGGMGGAPGAGAPGGSGSADDEHTRS